MKMFPAAQDDSSLIKKALVDIKSGKLFVETNDALMRAILHYIATATPDKQKESIETLKSHVKSLDMSNRMDAQDLIKYATDATYCEGVRNNPKFANYSMDAFKKEIDVAHARNSEYGEGLRITYSNF